MAIVVARGRGGGPRGQFSTPYKEFHFHVYYDGGIEDIPFDYENAESGWNKLGTYYLKADSAKVVLSNLSGKGCYCGCSKMGQTEVKREMKILCQGKKNLKDKS